MRPVVQLHTIDQWFQVDPMTRKLIVQHLKVRDKLWAWLMAREQARSQSNHNAQEGWRPCHECNQTGWVARRPRKPGLHPSGMGGQCLLRMHRELLGEPQAIVHDANLQLIFDFGTALHDMLQGYGEDGAWGQAYRKEVNVGETELAKKYQIQGHCDAENILVVDTIPDMPIYEVGLIHEYKSINDNGYKNLRNKPMPKHEQQAVVYSACLNRPLVVYLYLNKNDSSMADFPIEFKPELWQIMVTKAETVLAANAKGEYAPYQTGYHCQQCSYKYNCEPWKATAKKTG